MEKQDLSDESKPTVKAEQAAYSVGKYGRVGSLTKQKKIKMQQQRNEQKMAEFNEDLADVALSGFPSKAANAADHFRARNCHDSASDHLSNNKNTITYNPQLACLNNSTGGTSPSFSNSTRHRLNNAPIQKNRATAPSIAAAPQATHMLFQETFRNLSKGAQV
jgi:hypothetical protein